MISADEKWGNLVQFTSAQQQKGAWGLTMMHIRISVFLGNIIIH
jgi:hypothetical protein